MELPKLVSFKSKSTIRWLHPMKNFAVLNICETIFSRETNGALGVITLLGFFFCC